jgi:leucyl aminopeptidase (aminopeptidase T)
MTAPQRRSTAIPAPYLTILVDCLGVARGEEVLVVTDPERRPIAESLVAGARALEAEATLAEMSVRSGHAVEPPAAVAAAMLGAEVVVAPTTMSLSHTEARRLASEKGVRAATLPGVTVELLERTMSADYGLIRARSERVAEVLTKGADVRITSSAGTDVAFSIAGRQAHADTGDLTAPSSFGNLPAGEGFVAPVEGSAAGRVVFDGAVAAFGAPVDVTLEGGFATRFVGESGSRVRALIEGHGRDAFALAELGVGTNDAARLSGSVLEDEKILGTIHLAFGDNHSFGGRIRVASHIDLVVVDPTLTVDGVPLVEAGLLAV